MTPAEPPVEPPAPDLERMRQALDIIAHMPQRKNDHYFNWLIGKAMDGLGIATPPAPQQSFQARVQPWMMECFGPTISGDIREWCDRLLEEALELVQSLGYDMSRAHTLVKYVDNRPVGETPQEVGGVMVTLAVLCLAANVDMHYCGETELARIWTKIEKIRAKQAGKRDLHTPLPTDSPQPQGESVTVRKIPVHLHDNQFMIDWRENIDGRQTVDQYYDLPVYAYITAPLSIRKPEEVLGEIE